MLTEKAVEDAFFFTECEMPKLFGTEEAIKYIR
jgi:hypothetical protein